MYLCIIPMKTMQTISNETLQQYTDLLKSNEKVMPDIYLALLSQLNPQQQDWLRQQAAQSKPQYCILHLFHTDFTYSDPAKLHALPIYSGELSIFKYLSNRFEAQMCHMPLYISPENVAFCKKTRQIRKMFKWNLISPIFIIFVTRK